jgi:hypothetical protein
MGIPASKTARAVHNAREDRARPVNRVGRNGGENLGQEDGAGGDGMGEDPLPKRMAAALNVKLETFALEDEHDTPPQQDQRTEHDWRQVCGRQRCHVRRGESRRNQIGGSVCLHMLAQPLLDGSGRSTVAAREIDGLPVVGQALIFSRLRLTFGSTSALPSGAHRLPLLDCLVEAPVDDDLAAQLGIHALGGVDGLQQYKARASVQYHHKEGGHGDAEEAPVCGCLLPAALVEQLALSPPAAIRTPSCRTQQHPDRAPEAGWRLRGEGHDCAGRVVSRRKMSSSVSPGDWACCIRSSPMEPFAITVPSLMITAWEHSRVT